MTIELCHHRLLSLLCWQCRAATEPQLAATQHTTTSQIRSISRRLANAGLVVRRRRTVIEYQLTEPLAVSRQRADFAHVAWQLEHRWRSATRRSATVVWATRKAVRLVGGVSGRFRQPLQLQHDLGVTQVLTSWSHERGEKWIGEDAYRLFWQLEAKGKVPDAIILDQENQIRRAIEFGGRYSRERLQAFHRYWTARRIPYEIW